MKNILERLSVTKLVFLIVMVCLCVFTGYQIFTAQEIKNSLWENVVTVIISFYFGQKVWESKKDPLINLDNDKDDNGWDTTISNKS